MAMTHDEFNEALKSWHDDFMHDYADSKQAQKIQQAQYAAMRAYVAQLQVDVAKWRMVERMPDKSDLAHEDGLWVARRMNDTWNIVQLGQGETPEAALAAALGEPETTTAKQ